MDTRFKLVYRCGHQTHFWAPAWDVKAKKSEASGAMCPQCRDAERQGEPKSNVLVRCDSHRARENLKRSLNGALPVGWYVSRPGKMPITAKGFYKITPEQWINFTTIYAQRGIQTIVAPAFLHKCWTF